MEPINQRIQTSPKSRRLAEVVLVAQEEINLASTSQTHEGNFTQELSYLPGDHLNLCLEMYES